MSASHIYYISSGSSNGHYGRSPFRAIDILELLQHDLDFLAIGRIHRDEVKALHSAYEVRFSHERNGSTF